MTDPKRRRDYAEGCLYIADRVSDAAEAARLRRHAAQAIAKAERLEDLIRQQQGGKEE